MYSRLLFFSSLSSLFLSLSHTHTRTDSYARILSSPFFLASFSRSVSSETKKIKEKTENGNTNIVTLHS